MALKVSDIGEKELIKYILTKSKDIIPDDTAVTELNDINLISTCDMLIESKHFPDEMSYFQIYYKIPFIGGDTNEASEIIISGTALGLCDKPLMKKSAKLGDLICLTGDIGLAALGFNLKGDNIYTEKSLKPLARLKEGIIIKNAGATSATDITDGLASELYEMKPDSLGFMIYEDKFEISDEFKEISSRLDLNYFDLLLHVGEDFELLFTIDKDYDLDIDFKVIGEVNNSDKIEITLSNGEVTEIENRGYNHYVS